MITLLLIFAVIAFVAMISFYIVILMEQIKGARERKRIEFELYIKSLVEETIEENKQGK